MEIFFAILSGSFGGSIIVWLLRSWITEKLKQSIQHEYSQKLETYKAELNSKIQSIQHKYQIYQLRTSLFFDHQRNAFAQLLSKIAEVNQVWIEDGYDYNEEQFSKPVPEEKFKELIELYNRHQLFLDKECLMALDLLVELYSSSLPVYEGNGIEPTPRDINKAYNYVSHVQPLIAGLFRNKIGILTDFRDLRQLALLGGIHILNQYHFPEINLPVKGILDVSKSDSAADAVIKAEDNYDKLIEKLHQLTEYLRSDGGFFYDALKKSQRYIEILNSIKIN